MKLNKILISIILIFTLITTTTYAVGVKKDKDEWDGVTELKNTIINLMPKQAFIIENIEYNDIEYIKPSQESKDKIFHKLFLWILTLGLS